MSRSSERLVVLFIGGLGRSGSTVFELSLGTDERVAALGEVLHLWKRSLLEGELCGCERPFGDCEYWREVGEKAFGGWGDVDPQRIAELKSKIDRTIRTPQLAARLGSRTWKAEVREYAAYYSSVYRAAAEVSGSSIVVDSSKQPSLPYVLQYAEDLDVRVLHCIRDSRAVAHSWAKRVARPESGDRGHAHMKQYSPAVAALKWMQHNSVIEGLRLRGVPILRICYEDWAEAPVATVESALEFAGLDVWPNPRLDNKWVDLPVTHTCSGNPMRLKSGRVEIRRDEAWRAALSPETRRLVTTLTAPGLAMYGYFSGVRRGQNP